MDDQTPQEFQGRISGSKDWREIVAWVGDLPPMPQVAAKAISMVENPDTTAQDLTDVLAKDTALAARVLKIANSAMFARQREITTLNQAIMLIGFKALKGIIVAATLRQINKSFGPFERMVWENSMCTATAATLICKKLKKPYHEEIFLLGLLHSLGQVVLLSKADTAKDYKGVIEKIKTSGVDYATSEQEFFGFSHPLIGALVAKKWNFNAETCQVILHYKDPLEISRAESDFEHKVGIVQLSDSLAHAAGIGSPAGYPDQLPLIAELLPYVGFDPKTAQDTAKQLLEDTKAQFERDKAFYG
jgi:HD-like signal output (HDOD) protein